MRKLLLSVIALIIATVMISLNQSNDVKEDLSQENTLENVKGPNIAS